MKTEGKREKKKSVRVGEGGNTTNKNTIFCTFSASFLSCCSVLINLPLLINKSKVARIPLDERANSFVR